MGPKNSSSAADAAAPVMTMALHRKLEAIYEMIDGRNHKGALRAIERDLLAKHPTLQIARVLKGIVLSRSGSRPEGHALCEAVRLEGPTDDAVINTLALYYKNVGATAEPEAMFEAASSSAPRNPEYLRALHDCYARSRSHVKQQQCAMKLYRLTNHPNHITWAVCAMLLRCRDDPSLAQLACAMCAKLRASGVVTTREAFLVHLRALREAARPDQVLALLLSEAAETCVPMPAERAALIAAAHEAVGDSAAALARWRDVLTLAPDDWHAMSSALCLVMPGTRPAVERKPPPGPGGATSDPRAQTARGSRWLPAGGGAGAAAEGADGAGAPRGGGGAAFLDAGRAFQRELREAADAAGGPRSVGRGAYLLAVEVEWRGGSSESLASAISEHWRRFGDWTSCASDLAPYAERLRERGGEAAALLGEELRRAFDERANPNPNPTPFASVRDLRAFASAAAIRSTLGFFGGSWRDRTVAGAARGACSGLGAPALARGAGRALAASMLASHRAAREVVAGGDPREPTAADGLALLAAEALAAEAASEARFLAETTKKNPNADPGSSNGSAAVVHAFVSVAAACEEALERSPNHARLRFALVSALTLLGAANAAEAAFAPLDCKNIQMVSLAHVALPIACGGSGPDVASAHAKRAAVLRADAERDVADATVRAYENGTFAAALEFCAFRDRLERAHALAAWALVDADATFRGVWAAPLERPGDDETLPAGALGAALRARAAEAESRVLGPVSDARAGRCSFARKPEWFRHDEDLSLNPSWAPPHLGADACAAADWWRGGVGGAGRVPGDLPGDLRVPAGGAADAGVGAGASVAHRAGWTAALRRRALLAVATRDAFERGGRAEDSEDAAGGSEAAARRTAAADSAAALRGALRTLDGLSEDPDGSSEDAAGLRATLLRAAAPATARWAAVADAAIGACASLLEEEAGEAGEAGETRSGALEAFAAAFRDACASAAEGLRVGEGGEGGGEPGAAAAEDAIARLAARGVVPEAHHVVAGLGGDALAVVSAFAAAAAARGEGSGSGSGSRPEARDAARRAAAVVAEGAREVAEAAARAAEAATGAAAAEAAKRARAWFRDFARTSGEESDGGEGGERAVPSAETYEAVAGKIVASIAETLGETEAIGNALAARCRAVGAGE